MNFQTWKANCCDIPGHDGLSPCRENALSSSGSGAQNKVLLKRVSSPSWRMHVMVRVSSGPSSSPSAGTRDSS